MKRSAIALACLLALPALLRPARAEVLLLANGGRIEGELLNPDESPRKSYVLKLPSGGQITLEAERVSKVLTVRPELAEYEKVRPQYPDTAAGQWELAEWCRDHKLDAQRKIHLKRVIQLDPEQADARRLLGYHKVEGDWLTVEEEMHKMGKELYLGKWLLKQEIELLKSKQEQSQTERLWFGKIDRWRKWLNNEKDKKRGRENLLNIDDPAAVRALHDKLRTEPATDVRLLYLEPLSKINTFEARATLATVAIDDEEEEVRLSALDELQGKPDPKIIDYFCGRLNPKHKENTNVIINRAALALGRMKDPAAVLPLIKVLITTHKEVVGGGGGPGSMSTTFGTRGTPGGGLSMNQKPKVIQYQLKNQAVLNALVAITGKNFDFDQRAWETWYVTEQKSKPIDARRG